MRLFEIFIEDGWTVYRRAVAAKSKRKLPDVCGDGEKILSVEDVTKKCFLKDTVSVLRSDLRSKGWGLGEIELICALLDEHIKRTKKSVWKHGFSAFKKAIARIRLSHVSPKKYKGE